MESLELILMMQAIFEVSGLSTNTQCLAKQVRLMQFFEGLHLPDLPETPIPDHIPVEDMHPRQALPV